MAEAIASLSAGLGFDSLVGTTKKESRE